MAQATTPKAPYTLVEVDASSAVTPLALSWHNLTVADGSSPAGPSAASPTKEPMTPKPNQDEPLAYAPSHKLVLDGVSGEALPGKLLALLTPSRGVASALLDAIAQRTSPAAVVDGFVRVNHQPIRMTPTTTAFVPRQDALCPTLTVEEHLQLQARLRLDDQASHEERASRVAEVLAAVGLSGEVSHTRTGDVAGTGVGLSLLQRKLLAIATELLPNPSIVLLDEPTAGLDPFEAEAVVSCLQSLARAGHTVVAAMPLTQPTSAMFQLFDQLHVLTADGVTVFRGKPTDSLAFFEGAGAACPPLTNPFEFLARTLCVRDDADAARIQRLTNVWAAHEGGAGAALKTPILEGSIVPSELYAPPVFPRSAVSTQLSVLLRRSGLRLVRDVATLRMRFARALVFALVVGLIFLRLDISQTTVQSLSSACFFMVATQFIANALPELSSMPLEVGVVLRDHSNRLYHALSWYAVKNLSELPFQLALPLVFLAPAFFLVGFPADAEIFFTFYFFIMLVVSTGVAIALFASTVAPKPMLAFVLGLAMLAPAIIFGGAFVNRKTTPVYFLWLQQLSPVKYGFHGVMRAFWSHVDAIPCPPDVVCRNTSGAGVLATNIIRADAFASDWQILLAINLTLRALGGLALWRRAAAARATAAAPRN